MISKLYNFLIKTFLVFLPWKLKRFLLQLFYNYQLDETARIGLAWVYPKHLIMHASSSIDSFTVAVNLDSITLGHHSRIGRSNWITGFPTLTNSPHFRHQSNRRAELILGDHSAISKCHHIDCTNLVSIGAYTTIAGYRTQILTHSIDIKIGRQHSKPISIGSYCFIGTNCILLGGASLPNYSILGASSILNKAHLEPYTLYAGHPARAVKCLDQSSKYFSRNTGFVY